MALSLRKLKLNTRMILILGIMALLQTGFIGFFALHYLSQSLEEQIGQRAIHVAKTVASLPHIITAIEQRDTAFLQPISTAIADKTQALFVVIGDQHGIRLAHPTTAKVGLPMQDDEGDDNSPALIYGRDYVSKALGSLGWSMRGKAPVYNASGEQVIGVVSVGYQLDQVESIIVRYQATLSIVIAAAFFLSVLTAIWFARHFKKAIFGLEPEQIGCMFEELNATLESVREGIIAINRDGEITTFNHTAVETLELSPDIKLTGRPIYEVLPDSRMSDILKTGIPQFDQEIWLNNRNLIVNRIPIKQEGEVVGVVSSFRRKDELDLVSQKLTRIMQYADSLHSQAHEYSNKLHTIAGLIQIGATDKALSIIGHETQGHQALIQLLLNAVPDPVVAGCLLGKYNRAKELGLELEIDTESRMSEIPNYLPIEQLVSVMGNLIDNALEATLNEKGKGGVVKLSMTDLGNDLIFEVEDQGAGIQTLDYEAIFEKGVSTKPDSGHGIGLYLVKRLIDSWNGNILFEPVEPNGSRFTIYIPKSATQNIRESDSP